MPERWEQEIDELLKRRENSLPNQPPRRIPPPTNRRFSGVAKAMRAFTRRPLVEQLMIGSIVLVAASFFLQILYIPAAMTNWIAGLSLLMFVIAIGLSYSTHRRHGGDSSRHWRDQDVRYSPPRPSLWEDIRRWFRRVR
jgi:uncharacterized membrane protein YbhN (UPF0104 family)